MPRPKVAAPAVPAVVVPARWRVTVQARIGGRLVPFVCYDDPQPDLATTLGRLLAVLEKLDRDQRRAVTRCVLEALAL